MQWMTSWPRERGTFELEPGAPLCLLGSCFAEHLSGYLRRVKCRVASNPAGIVYNPASLAGAIDRWVRGVDLPARFVTSGGGHHSLDHHSALSALGGGELAARIAAAEKAGREAVRQAGVAVITLGTAWAYRWVKDGAIVANCHKLPAGEFEKVFLPPGQVTELLETAIEHWRRLRPDLEVVLTVSPVRHLRDGFTANQRSKASLILAAHTLAERLPYVHYFPAYELLIDELRDYRFYDRDMVHPAPAAVEHILQAFADCYFSDSLQSLATRVQQLHKALSHRPFLPQSAAYSQHLERTAGKLATCEKDFPSLDWSGEYQILESLRQKTREDIDPGT